MSTRSIIGVYDDKAKGRWHGVYHHWDGYPTGVGKTILEIGKKRGFEFFKKEVIEAHPEGWSTLNGDWDKPPENMREEKLEERSDAPKHYDPKNDPEMTFSQKDPAGTAGSEYLYLADDKGFDVFDVYYHSGEFEGQRMIGAFGMGAPDIGKEKEVAWRKIGRVTWKDKEAKLKKIEKEAYREDKE